MNEILDGLQSIFSAAFTTTFNKYFKGRIKLPAQSDLPILAVYPIGDSTKRSGTVRDKEEFRIGVEIIISLKQYLDSTNGDGDKLDTLERLVELVDGRDANNDLEDATIKGILNANLSIGSRVLYTNNIEVAYEEYLSNLSFPAAKVVVTFTAYNRPNRV